jgi:hypothetical protein
MEKETNLEHYLKRLTRAVQEAYGRPTQIFDTIQKYIDPGIERKHLDYTSDILEWMAQEYKGDILDYSEKKYLSEVIRPFREEVTAIEKLEAPAGREYIVIILKDDGMHFPCFKKDTRYKGLEYDKTYTPEELGL